MAVVFRPPVVTRIGKIKGIQAFDVPNLLLTTLAVVVVAAAPFIPSDQSQPVRKLRVQQVDPQPNQLLNLLTPTTRPPFSNFDSTQPRARKSAQVDVVNRIRANFTSAPFYPVDGSQPRAIRKSIVDSQQISPLLNPVVAQAAPFSNFDSTQPRPLRRQTTSDFQYPIQLLPVVVAPAPFAPIDNDAPRPKRRTQSDDPQISPLLLSAPIAGFSNEQPPSRSRVLQVFDQQTLLFTIPVIAPAPFFNPETTQPRTRRVVQRDDVQRQLPNNAGPPIFSVDGEQPRPVRRAREDAQPNLLLSTLVPLVSPAPFYPVDLAQPRAKRSVQADADSSTIQRLPTDTLPTGLQSNEQPRARRVPQVTGTENPLAGPLWFIPASPMPIGHGDMPQWRRHREAPDQHLVNSLLTTLQPTAVQLPFPPVIHPQIKPTRLIQDQYSYPVPLVLLNPESPYKIDGQSSAHIAVAYGSITVYNDGLGNYFTIAKV